MKPVLTCISILVFFGLWIAWDVAGLNTALIRVHSSISEPSTLAEAKEGIVNCIRLTEGLLSLSIINVIAACAFLVWTARSKSRAEVNRANGQTQTGPNGANGTAKPQPITRTRTCRACGQPFDYPLPGSTATRHYCEQCVEIPPAFRRVAERLLARIETLERNQKPSGPQGPQSTGSV